MSSPTHKDILEKIKKSKTEKVKLAITDLDGILRGKYVQKDKFLSAAEGGMGFCNVVFGWDANDVCYDNSTYTGWHSGYPDAEVQLDLDTFREVPWDYKVPFFLGDFVDGKGGPLKICPRQLLKGIIAQSQEQGFFPHFGLEFEWFNFKESPQSFADKNYVDPTPLTPGMFGYSILRAGQNGGYFNAIMDECLEFKIPIEGLHTETGPGVYEAAITVAPALEAADRAVLFKSSVKEIAHRFEIMPSFMAKWDATLPGCSGHMHQSLWDEKNQTNTFFNHSDPNKMSDIFKSYLAGQMHCLPHILPMFAPTVNSYKRLTEGLWAPTRVTWGIDNRTSSFRVIPGSEKSTRLETRVAGSDMNPYLGVAAALASGLYGIKNNLSLSSPPVKGNAYEQEGAPGLSRNLYKATEVMAKSDVARELFGDEFVNHFVASRHWEWREFQQAVTDWELKRYFEII